MTKTKEKQPEQKVVKEIYPLGDALKVLKKNATANFVEKVDVSLQTGIDSRKMMVRGMVSLPHGTGKSVKIAVFANGEHAKAAKEAGANILVSGSTIFRENKGDLKKNIEILRNN